MTNILIISGVTPPDVSATGKIARSIAGMLALKKRTNVTLLALTSDHTQPETETKRNLKIVRCLSRYGVYKREAQKGGGLPHKIKVRALRIWQEKCGSHDFEKHEKQMIKTAQRIIETDGITVVFTVSHPFGCHEVGAELKKTNPSLIWLPYYTDSYSANPVSAGSAEHEAELLTLADKIFITPYLVNDPAFTGQFAEKQSILHLPIIQPAAKLSEDNAGHRSDGRTVVIYSGLFYEKIRNPEMMLKVFASLPDKYVLHLYTRGCQDKVKEYTDRYPKKIIYHGFVPPDELEKRLSAADAFINIGNNVVNQVPSKLYDYIAQGKPVINFYSSDGDIGKKHLDLYPLALSLDVNLRSPKEMAADITGFLERHKGERLDYNTATASLEEHRLKNVSAKLYSAMGELQAERGTDEAADSPAE